MSDKPIVFEDKMKYRDNEFLYDKCIKQHDCIINYQWKMREYKEIINKAIEYIEKHKQIAMFADLRKEGTHQYTIECDADDLLSILRGEE